MAVVILRLGRLIRTVDWSHVVRLSDWSHMARYLIGPLKITDREIIDREILISITGLSVGYSWFIFLLYGLFWLKEYYLTHRLSAQNREIQPQ